MIYKLKYFVTIGFLAGLTCFILTPSSIAQSAAGINIISEWYEAWGNGQFINGYNNSGEVPPVSGSDEFYDPENDIDVFTSSTADFLSVNAEAISMWYSCNAYAQHTLYFSPIGNYLQIEYNCYFDDLPWSTGSIFLKDETSGLVMIDKSGDDDLWFYPHKIYTFTCDPGHIYSLIISVSAPASGDWQDASIEVNIFSDTRKIYVDDDAPAGGDGSNWSNAFNNLQSALDIAQYGDEIWVASGTYVENITLKNGVAIFGAGASTTTIAANKSESVITSRGCDPNTVLDGFTISGGSKEAWGGGMYNFYSYPTVTNCTFTGNGAFCWGGGMANDHSDPTVTGCTFTGNSVYVGGGGMANNHSDPTVTDCSFIRNEAFAEGGGMYNESSDPNLTNCIFIGHSVFDSGGGMKNNNSNPTLTNCTFSGNSSYDGEGGGMVNFGGRTTLINCTFSDNAAAWGGGAMYSTGEISLINCNFASTDDDICCSGIRLLCTNCIIGAISGSVTGNSTIDLGNHGNITVVDSFTLNGDTKLIGAGLLTINHSEMIVANNANINLSEGGRIQCDGLLRVKDNATIKGAGLLTINLDSEMIVTSQANINLSGGGMIHCNGLLRVKDNANISNTKLNVSRSSFEDDVIIFNSVVTAEAGLPFGQFFIEDTVTVTDNEIHADGDRYMDLDPNVFQGIMKNNRIYVLITEGVSSVRGGLLELRGQKDLIESYTYDPNNIFLCRVDPNAIPDCNILNWSLQELKLIEDAKVNLTNRFDFQPPYNAGGTEEVLYVKDLILGNSAVLNTSFNRIYYENLIVEPNSIIKNEPLLGFSLNNIACNNNIEFLYRILHNNLIDLNSNDPNFTRIHVEHVKDLPPDTDGMIRMRNMVAPDSEDLIPPQYEPKLFHARAKGVFAQTSKAEDRILIWFEYLFCSSDPATELVIYLSDVRELQDSRDPGHYLEVALLPNPPVGRAGAYGSGRFGVFQEYVSTGDLNFIRGLRMELELVGPEGSCVLINNWDPMILCDPLQVYCKDVTGDFGVTVADYLSIFGEYGNSASPTSDPMAHFGRACLDGSFNKDGYVDLNDMMEWSWFLAQEDRKNLCDVPMAPGLTAGSLSSMAFFDNSEPITPDDYNQNDSDESFLVASVQMINDEPYLKDKLYLFNQQGQSVDSVPPPADTMSHRLVQDADGGVYQLNLEQGLMRFWDPCDIAAPPGQIDDIIEPRYHQSATVYIGLQQNGDQWFGRPLVDAAFDDQGYVYVLPVVVVPANVNDTYLAAAKLELNDGQTPPYNLVQLYDDPPLPGDNQQRNSLREIEVDDQGNVYIINSHDLNESDLLWVFDADTGALKDSLNFINTNIPAPIALHVSSSSDLLYLASSQNDPDANSTNIYALAADTFNQERLIEIEGMGHITGITEDPATGTIWAAGFRMENIPVYPKIDQPAFYHPLIAEIPSDNDDPVSAAPLTGASSMTIPMSLLWIGDDKCGGADLDSSGVVNLADFYIMRQYWLDEGCTTLDGCGKANLDNTDGKDTVNLVDFAYFAQYWLWDC